MLKCVLLERLAIAIDFSNPENYFLFYVILFCFVSWCVWLYLMDVFVQTSDSEQPTSIKSRLPLGKGSFDVELLELETSTLVRLTPRNISRGLKPREIFFGVT